MSLKSSQIAYNCFLFFLLEWSFYWTSSQQTVHLAKKTKSPSSVFLTVLLLCLYCSPGSTCGVSCCSIACLWQCASAADVQTPLASRHRSLQSTSTKETASFHLCTNIGLVLFFRNDTVIIYFSGSAGKVARWETTLGVTLIQTIILVSL